MKKLLIAVFAVVLSTGAFAQETQPAKDTIPTEQKVQKKNGYLMKESKMWTLKDGVKSEQTDDVTLANGTIVMANGTVKSTDGQTVTLKNGQFIDLDGKITEWKEDGTGN